MKTIFKYQIKDEPTIRLPVGYRILDVQVQNGEPHLWALVDDGLPTEEVPIEIYGTGYDASEAELMNYAGTFQVYGGSLVFHVFIGMK